MTWTRLPDDFTEGPAVLQVGRSARLLHVEALVWCNRHLTDGVLPTAALTRITDSDSLDQDVGELAAAGLWTMKDDRTWQVDWSDQESSDRVEKRRGLRNQRQQRYNERRERHAGGDHSMCDPRFCPKARDASRDASPNPSDDGLPTPPGPARPEGEGQGQGGEGGSASSDGSAPLAASPAPPPAEPASHALWWAGEPPPDAVIYVDDIEVNPNHDLRN